MTFLQMYTKWSGASDDLFLSLYTQPEASFFTVLYSSKEQLNCKAAACRHGAISLYFIFFKWCCNDSDHLAGYIGGHKQGFQTVLSLCINYFKSRAGL